jgi:D-alanyl-D-alanine carboxypeptidase/D-alanyl-D-alanine-endopeptidase (penicillin-binding protein 4)
MVSNERLGVMNDEKIIDTLLNNDLKALPQKPRWVDGSGLSRYNLFSPQDFVFILDKMSNEFSWSRITTIFPSGGDGTLGSYFKNLHGKIFAKTGSLSNNATLSGYIITKKNRTLIFSILVNNHATSSMNIRKDSEKFLQVLYEKY